MVSFIQYFEELQLSQSRHRYIKFSLRDHIPLAPKIGKKGLVRSDENVLLSTCCGVCAIYESPVTGV